MRCLILRTVLRTIALVVVSSLLFMLTSCGNSAQDKVVGRWQSSANEIIEFTDDGRFTMNSFFGTHEGVYKAVDDDYIDLSVSGLIGAGISGRWKVQAEGDVLALVREEDGTVLRLVKF